MTTVLILIVHPYVYISIYHATVPIFFNVDGSNTSPLDQIQVPSYYDDDKSQLRLTILLIFSTSKFPFDSSPLSCCCFALIGESSSIAPTVTFTGPLIQVRQLSRLIPPIFDLGGFCVHLSLPSSTQEGTDPILHVTYSFVDSVSAYNSNVDDLLLILILVLAPIIIMILFLLRQVHVQSDLDDSPGDNNDSDTSIVMLL